MFKAVMPLMLTLAAAPVTGQFQYPFQDPNVPIEARIDNVLSLMTLEEKLAAMGMGGIRVPRLGIRGTGIGEALSGVVLGGPMMSLMAPPAGGGQAPGGAPPAVGSGQQTPSFGIEGLDPKELLEMFQAKPVPTTQFPQGVGLARTWNPGLVRRAGAVIGSEARYIYENGKTRQAALVLLTPNADLARDPRWGRTQETYGEDAFLNGTMAAALIRGIQGDDPRYWQAASLLKHFLANSNERNRYGSSSDFDARLFREYYSAPFRMGFVEGGARSYMTAYNAWNKVPLTSHPALRNITMKEWGVDGIICTDAGGFTNQVTKHKFYATRKEAAAATIKAGVNLFLDGYQDAVKEALKDGSLKESDIDAALRGSFRTLIRLGLLDPPAQVPYAKWKGAPDPVNSDVHNGVERQVALESVVLLKNSAGLLPLNRQSLKSIAVIGPLADEVLPDLYSGQPPYGVTPLEGIRRKVAAGVTINYARDNTNQAAVKAAKSSEVAVVVVGNHPLCGGKINILESFAKDDSRCALAGEGMENNDRSSLELEQEALIKEVYQANPKTVVALVSGAPYAINWTEEYVPAILHTSHAGQEEGYALAEVLFGDYNPAGRLVQTWVRSLDQLPPMMDYNIRNGRTYMYFRGTPLYPFGYGLSYTSFKYSNLRTSAPALAPGGQVTVSVDVTNTGTRDGDEVVQLYVSYPNSKVSRPLKELKVLSAFPSRAARRARCRFR
jgi:beta-glucosidase